MADASDIEVLCAAFNYDLTSLFVSTKDEVKVFGLENFVTLYESKKECAHLMVQLWGTDILCVVTRVSPRKMDMIRISDKSTLSSKNFPSEILDIKSNKYVKVVGCRDGFNFYEMSEFKPMKTLRRPSGFEGPFALSQAIEGGSYLASPVSMVSGDIEIFDIFAQKKVVVIRAHNSPLASMVFHPTEQVLATASKKGTVIRLISIPNGTKLFEFRRGIQRNADIYSLSFSRDSNYLACSGSTGTVHVFKYYLPSQNAEDQSWSEYIGGAIKSSANTLLAPLHDMTINPRQGWMSYLGGMISSSATYIPKQMYEVCNQARSFQKIRPSDESLKNISTIASIEGVMRVVVFTEDSYISVYELKEGSSCSLVSKYSPVTGKVPIEVLRAWCPAGDDSYDSTASVDHVVGVTE